MTLREAQLLTLSVLKQVMEEKLDQHNVQLAQVCSLNHGHVTTILIPFKGDTKRVWNSGWNKLEGGDRSHVVFSGVFLYCKMLEGWKSRLNVKFWKHERCILFYSMSSSLICLVNYRGDSITHVQLNTTFLRQERFSGQTTHLAMHSISISTSFGRRATSTADRAGAWFPKNFAYISLTVVKSFMDFKKTYT
jgi:hypothetical protein